MAAYPSPKLCKVLFRRSSPCTFSQLELGVFRSKLPQEEFELLMDGHDVILTDLRGQGFEIYCVYLHAVGLG